MYVSDGQTEEGSSRFINISNNCDGYVDSYSFDLNNHVTSKQADCFYSSKQKQLETIGIP